MAIHQVIKPDITAFFDKDSNTFSYVVKDPDSSSCAIIDSVMDFDYASGATFHTGANQIIEHITQHKLHVDWLIETHIHADHLSAAPYLRHKLGGKIGIGEQVTTIQGTFARIFNEGDDLKRDGSQFDHLFHDGEHYYIGNMQCTALHTPGHTPACFTHIFGDAVFVGDTLFMPDAGTARADFPGGDAGTLFDSIQKILALPEDYRIYLCHDYCPNGRKLKHQTTVKAQREHNIHVKHTISRSEFVYLRETRDNTLAMPRLILPSLQINIKAGDMPKPEDNGLSYLKIPLNAFK